MDFFIFYFYFLEDFILSLVINKAKRLHKPKWGSGYYGGGKSHLGGVKFHITTLLWTSNKRK